MANTKEFSLF